MAQTDLFRVSEAYSIKVHDLPTCRDALSQLLAPVKLHLEELVIERCSDFLSRGTLHFSPMAAVSRLRVSNPLSNPLSIHSRSGNTSRFAARC